MHKSNTRRFCRLPEIRSLPVSAVLCLMLLFVQSADLIHTHKGDLQRQFDCEICLKIGSSTDVIPSIYSPVEVAPATQRAYAILNRSVYVLEFSQQQARAPPLPA